MIWSSDEEKDFDIIFLEDVNTDENKNIKKKKIKNEKARRRGNILKAKFKVFEVKIDVPLDDQPKKEFILQKKLDV